MRMVRNLGMRNSLLSLPMPRDQCKAGPFDVRRMAAAIPAIGITNVTRPIEANAMSNFRLARTLFGVAIRINHSRMEFTGKAHMPWLLFEARRIFQREWQG